MIVPCKRASCAAKLAACEKELEEVKDLREIYHCLQGAVTCLAVGNIECGSRMHHKMRDTVIQYRECRAVAEKGRA
jgi:hypothetical protein